MLHLNSRVHLDEIMLSVIINKEFNGSCTSVVYGLGNLDRVVADILSLFFCYGKSRCEFHNLLMPSLDRTVTFIKMNNIAIAVSQHLNLYMLRPFEILLDKNIIDSKSLLGFALGTSVLIDKFLSVPYNSHSSSAAARCSLQHYRVAAVFCELECHFL